MDLRDVVGDVAVLSTVCLFITGIPICYKIWLNRSTLGTSSLPFLTAFVSCSFWVFYGTMKNDVQIKLVNLFGLLLQIVYIGFYVHMSTSKVEMRNKVLIAICTPFIFLYTLRIFCKNADDLTWYLGLLACIAGVIFCSSPLANIALVIRTQNTSSMPLPLIVLSFLQSLLWFIYGVLAKDLFVQVPNLLSVTVTLLQLFLFLIFTGSAKDGLVIEQGIN